MNENLIKVIFIVAVIGFIWIFLIFKPVRRALYLISGSIVLFLTLKTAFNGEFWFLDLSKLELAGFSITIYLMHSNYKHAKNLNMSAYNSIKEDFVFIGLPCFYVFSALIVAFLKTESRYQIPEQHLDYVISETIISTILLLVVIMHLLVRNITLRFLPNNEYGHGAAFENPVPDQEKSAIQSADSNSGELK
jgi:hypothetical protein